MNAATGAPTDKSDVGDQQYAWAALHSDLWKEFPDSNPYGILVTRDAATHAVRTFAVNAGSNKVSEVMAGGTNRVIAFIPNDPIRDSTPTCVAQGPDGALYVGTLDLVANLFAIGPGQSHVYRVDPNANETFPPTTAHVWAGGLTTITSAPSIEQATSGPPRCFSPTRQARPATSSASRSPTPLPLSSWAGLPAASRGHRSGP